MAIGTPYITEGVPVAINGVISVQTASQIVSTFGASNVKTATADFTINYNGETLDFSNGEAFVVDAGLLAALTAANAPVA